MLTKIKISGFRSIKDQEIELSKINLIYGETATGKSSILYSLLVLKNFVKNPNQQVDAFFNLRFLNLGGFDESVFNHDQKREIKIGFSIKDGEYEVGFKENQVKIKQVWNKFEMNGDFPLPYLLNKNFTFEFDKEFTVNWNGIISDVIPKTLNFQNQQKAREITEKLNFITSVIDNIDIIPSRRGFFKSSYSPSLVSINPYTDDEVAAIIINNPNLASKISADLEKILNRDFRLYTPPGTAVSYFQTMDKKSRMPINLVNDGFGVNQV
ncbi:MAG: AAA family ATPase, partial [Candidatus Calescibacterium sp.]